MSDDSIADTDWQELTACVGLQQTGPIDMKTIFAAAIALAMGTGAAHAQAGGAGLRAAAARTGSLGAELVRFRRGRNARSG
jgi:hypothetical protein